jgi:hypothetical protein
MRFQDTAPRERKRQDKRRGVRLNSRVPVAIEWEGEASQSVRVEAHTRVVGPYGCLVVLAQNLDLEKRLRVTNLANHWDCLGVVVWKGTERAEGWELGIELIEPEMGFWGLEL